MHGGGAKHVRKKDAQIFSIFIATIQLAMLRFVILAKFPNLTIQHAYKNTPRLKFRTILYSKTRRALILVTMKFSYLAHTSISKLPEVGSGQKILHILLSWTINIAQIHPFKHFCIRNLVNSIEHRRKKFCFLYSVPV